MSTQPETAETETAPETTVEQETAPVIPGREDVLKQFAREIMGTPETAAPPAEAEAENAAEALSQTESETEAEPETTETETPADDSEDDHGDLPPEVQEKINKRIGKEVAKSKAALEAKEEAEAKLAEAQAKLAEFESGQIASPKSKVQLADIHDKVKLAAEKQRAEQAVEDAEELLLTLEDDPNSVEQALRTMKVELKDEDGDEDFSEARMKKFLRTAKMNAERTLRKAIPEREQFLDKANQFATQAMDFMPELIDPKSERAKLFQQIFRENPELRQQPEWALKGVIGVLGMERLNEMVAAKQKAKAPAKKPEKPVTIPAPRTAAPAVTAKPKATETDVNATAEKILNGDKSARLNYIKSLVPKSA